MFTIGARLFVCRYDMIYTINITSMMVLASIYLSVSTSLPRCPSLYPTQTTDILFSTDTIKPVEKWLLFNLGYPFMVIISNIIEQVKHLDLFIYFILRFCFCILEICQYCPTETNRPFFNNERKSS